MPLALVGELLLVDCGVEIFSERLLCGMEVSCRLYVDVSRSSRQGFYCGKVRLKWQRKSRSERYVRQDAASDIFFSSPRTRPMEV